MKLSKLLTKVAAASLLLTMALPVQAGRFKQSVYLSNAYFCNELKNDDGNLQPDRVFNVMKANESELRAAFVMNVIADEGVHNLEVDLLNNQAERFDRIKLQPVTADSDDFVYTAVAMFGGSMPPGGVFFKIFDVIDGKRKEVATVRIMTVK